MMWYIVWMRASNRIWVLHEVRFEDAVVVPERVV